MSGEPAPAPAPAPEPFLYHEGQPITASEAGRVRATLMGNPEFMKEALAGPTEANKKMAALWALERGIQLPPPTTVSEVEQQTLSRAERDQITHEETLRAAGFNELQAFEVANQRPLLPSEKKHYQRELERMIADQGFRARVLAKDREALAEFRKASVGAKLPTGSLDDIKAWEVAHGLVPAAK
jgi:hypothetical protein